MSYLYLVLQTPLILSAAAIIVLLIVTRGRTKAALPAGRSTFMRRIAFGGSLAVLLTYLAVKSFPVLDLAQRYLFPDSTLDFSPYPTDYRWWAYPLPIAAAILVITIVLARLAHDNARVEIAVLPVRHRGWLSFARTFEVIMAAGVLALLLVVSILAGLASATDENGLHTLIVMPGADLVGQDNFDVPGRATFYGWAYSVPVMLGVAVLALLVWWAIRTSSGRSFIRPETVDAETRERKVTTSVLLQLFTGTVLLSLGSALASIGDSGQGSTGVGIPGVGDFNFTLGYSSFAPALSILGSILQTVAVVMLVAAIRGKRVRAAAPELVRS